MWPFGKSTEDRLNEALKDNAMLGKLKLEAKVAKKRALISGEVPNERYLGLIEAVATGINGIDSVDTSSVKVMPPAESKQPAATAPSSSSPSASTPSASTPSASTPSASAKSASTPPTVPVSSPAPAPEPMEDPSAKAKAAYQKIRAEASLANNPLDVLQKGSTIVLRGAVDSQEEFDKAKRLAMSVMGVTGVDTSGLQIIQNASQLNTTDDEGDVIYTVKSGDTLSHIALHYYGSAGPKAYMRIAEANGLADPNKIYVGQQLKIPGTTAGPDAQLS